MSQKTPNLILTPAQFKQIRVEGSAAYPNECCGILFGRTVTDQDSSTRVVQECRAVDNGFDEGEQYHRFRITADVMLKAMRSCNDGRDVLGFYHSHPDHPARPSEYDRAHAWPFYSYVIVAIEKRTPADMTSWVLDEQTEQFGPQEIQVSPDVAADPSPKDSA